MLPVTIGDQASIDQALAYRKGRRAVRRAASLRRQLRRRAADADAIGLRSPSTSSAAGRSTASCRRRPASRCRRRRSDHRHPLPDQPARRDVRSRTTNAPHTVDQWFNTGCFVRRAGARTPARARATPAATPSAGPASRAPTCRCSRTSSFGGEHRIQVRRRGVQPVQPDALRPARRCRSARPNFGQITSAAGRTGDPAGGEVPVSKGTGDWVTGVRRSSGRLQGSRSRRVSEPRLGRAADLRGEAAKREASSSCETSLRHRRHSPPSIGHLRGIASHGQRAERDRRRRRPEPGATTWR